MVTSAVLGAATGTGLALVVAMTIVVYRYYASRRWGKEWNYKGSWTAGPATYYYRTNKAPSAGYAVTTQKVFNVAKEQHVVQPIPTVAAHSVNTELLHSPLEVSPGTVLTHQSRSYPGVQGHLSRTPSVSSQSSLDSSISKQSHRGSSPQIRTFAPDGRVALTRVSSTQEREPPQRSPSPHRSPSFDSRASPSLPGDLRTPSPSQTSLVSVCSSPAPQSPRARCLSPLLLPPRSQVQEPPPASPLGTLQPDLYQKREGPLYLRNGNRSGPSLGRLHLRLKYDFDRSDLHVHLIEAHELAGSAQGGFNDPYVRLSMSPEVDARKRQTAIHRNDANPYFDQHFKFPVSHEDLQDKTLILQVFDYDRFSRNDVVGEVRVNMYEMDVTSSVEAWCDITKHKKPPEELQEVLLSLSYLPSAERLTVVLLKARNLFQPQEKESIDPFVKVYLLSNGKRVKKKKTAARKGCANPVWNEALTFNVSSSNLGNSAVEVCVMYQGNDLIGNTPLLGSCVIGPHEEGAGQDHWTDMTQSPRKAVAMWHTLR